MLPTYTGMQRNTTMGKPQYHPAHFLQVPHMIHQLVKGSSSRPQRNTEMWWWEEPQCLGQRQDPLSQPQSCPRQPYPHGPGDRTQQTSKDRNFHLELQKFIDYRSSIKNIIHKSKRLFMINLVTTSKASKNFLKGIRRILQQRLKSH